MTDCCYWIYEKVCCYKGLNILDKQYYCHTIVRLTRLTILHSYATTIILLLLLGLLLLLYVSKVMFVFVVSAVSSNASSVNSSFSKSASRRGWLNRKKTMTSPETTTTREMTSSARGVVSTWKKSRKNTVYTTTMRRDNWLPWRPVHAHLTNQQISHVAMAK